MPLINQPTAKPTRKMAATGGALTLTTLLVLAASPLFSPESYCEGVSG